MKTKSSFIITGLKAKKQISNLDLDHYNLHREGTEMKMLDLVQAGVMKSIKYADMLDMSAAENVPVKVSEEISSFDYGLDKSDLGRPGTLRNTILTLVLEERYELALSELENSLERKTDYPNFRDRVERFVRHCKDLVFAIKAKRSFPGINSLTRAKQQELREKFKIHFKELQYTLKVIEKIHYDLRIKDVRSTVYVVKALSVSVAAIVAVGFMIDFVSNIGPTGWMLISDALESLATWVINRLPF